MNTGGAEKEAASSLEDVLEDEIRGMGGAQIFKLARQHRLSLSGCNDVEQFRERLLLHVRAQKGLHYDIQHEFGSRHSEGLDNTRQTLDSLLDTVQAAITDLSPTLERALRMDSGGGDKSAPLVQQIRCRRRSLITSDCSVIVAGETNAGKSTFLNLLLGMDVLPTNIFSCTAAVCVLQHAPTFTAQIHSHKGLSHSEEFLDATSTKQWLELMVAEQNQEKREQGLDIHAIHVHLPALILQNGVTLVDTPGIGENEAMTKCTMDYVRCHSAAAYLYIIKTDNAGGVQDDRLLDFLRAILHYHEQDSTSDVFNPSATMFVCNRWDQVPVEQRQGVRENAIQKLKDVWPKFESRQSFFMSSSNAQVHVSSDPRYITEDSEKVLRGLKEMFGQARHNVIDHHYRWLKHFLHESTSFLQTAIHHCSMSDEQLIARFKSTRLKLDALQRHTTATTQQLRQHVQQATEQLCSKIRQMLRDQAVKEEVMDWRLEALPSGPSTFESEQGSELAQTFKQRHQVKRWQEEVDAMIMRRTMETVDKQVQQQGLDRELQDNLRQVFREELKLVDDEINSILTDLTETTSLSSSMSSNSSCMSSDLDEDHAMEMLRLYKQRDGFRLTHLRHLSRMTQSSSARTSSHATISSVPKVMVRRLVAGILGPLMILARTVQGRRRSSQFNDNPEQYIRNRTEKIMRVVSETDDCLAQMAAKFHNKMDAFISDVENSVPMFIANNQQQMEDIRVNRKSYLSQRKELISLMEHLEPVRHLLQGFGSLYIRDLTADNIDFVLDADQRRASVAVNVMEQDKKDKGSKDSGIGDSRHGEWGTTVGGSLWSTFRKGHVTIGDNNKDIMGRTYIQPPAEQTLIKEIARLRCLRCDDLAPFLGMTRMDDSAVFLFMGHLRSARSFLSKGFHKPSESVPLLLDGVLKGLHYLHREGLVHMELSLDTIMVNGNGEPRLCGTCLPRRARFPPDADRIRADPFVCLSPEVLRDELYTAEDDCYSFGLLVWETCLPEKPYRQYRYRLSLQEFRNKVHPSSMLGLDACENVSDTLTAILRGCLLPARGLRTKAEELKERVSELRSDPVVLALSGAHRRTHFHNRPIKRAPSDDT